MNPSSLTMQNAFDFFQCEEKLEENNTWYCSKCKKHQEAFKKLDIYKPSKYLIIQFKRFQIKSNNMIMSLFSNKKISTFINYDVNDLDLRKYVIGPERSKAVYNLYGVVEHWGSLRFGHYTALCKTAQGNWMRFDDETCKDTDNAVVKDAYLLFYKMKSNN
jgi:ubiquitin C-terminal hydrolase